MVNIDEIRQLCYSLLAKQKQAFPSPKEYNLYANLANTDLFNYYNDLRRDGLLKVKTGINITVPQALNPFLVMDTHLTPVTVSGATVATLPETLTDLLSVSSGATRSNVSIVDYDKRNNVLNSSIDGPTADKPVILQQALSLLVYPVGYALPLYVSYLRLPATISWAYTLNGNTPVYNSGASINFEWLATEKINLVMRILKYMGLSVREAEITNFAQQQEQIAN